MLFFLIELDEEKITSDKKIKLDKAYECIDSTFVEDNITLHHKEGAVRYYTRNIDSHDFELLWLNNDAFRAESWFQYYIKQWKYIDIDDDTNEIYIEEDLTENWVIRPERP